MDKVAIAAELIKLAEELIEESNVMKRADATESHRKLTSEDVSNLEYSIFNNTDVTDDSEIELVKYNTSNNLYYVKLRSERGGIYEIQAKLDWGVSSPPGITEEIKTLFHANDFDEVIYRK